MARMSDSPGEEAIGVPARMAALRMLDAVLNRGQTLDSAQSNYARGLPPEDAGFALVMASEVLRWLVDLDALIDGATAQPLPKDAKARSVLRLALVQIVRLETPAHAAIATALPLVSGGPKRLVHGVFGAVTRSGKGLPAKPTLPENVAARWGHWGFGALGEIAAALGEQPPVTITRKDGTSETLARGTRIAALPGYDEGAFWVQNLSAALPARLLGAGEGRHVLDLCAAPGGKTMQLASAGWRVTAVDNSAKRMERLKENLARTKLPAETIVADLRQWEPAEPADAILLDAPCTATGTLARHPDVIHRIGPKDIATLAELQGQLLARAAGWLKPGGRLIYATCSNEREEGEAIAANAALPVEPLQIALPDWVQTTPEGWLRILPKPGIDGFFIAPFRKPD
ncbi:MAG TPA: transcription antitermination factor NusB [Sphingomonas sp.]|nr:transcription antitermination factor NusB [Sphingomonas sp.]